MNIKIMEVGPRDGLQNEDKSLTLEDKKRFIDMLIEAGHSNIEIGAFVNPQKIPQMASSGELASALTQNQRFSQNSKAISKSNATPKSKATLWALVPNKRGFDDFASSGLTHLAVFTAASETFNQKNINASIAQSFERMSEFLPDARKRKMGIRGYISTCFGCPYEGKIEPKAVLKVTENLLKLGIQEVSIGDTIGVANPTQARKLTRALLKLTGPKKLALHFHDTRGTALANILAGLEEGVRIFDSSSGGLGGCPYAPGAAGNVATEDLLYMLDGMGCKTGIDIDLQSKASEFIGGCLGRSLPSRYLEAGPFAALSDR